MVSIRSLQIVVLAFIAAFFTIIVINNITDYATNHWCVAHVLSMEGVHSQEVKWRAIENPKLQNAAYVIIIFMEYLISGFCWAAVFQMADYKKAVRGKALGFIGLVMGFALFFGGFVVIGGEWFYMWQSPILGTLQTKATIFSLVMLAGIIFLTARDEKLLA